MAQTLTVAEKILYHLTPYVKAEEKYEVPFDITQDGIAQSCGISRAHAAIELKKLREFDLIVEKLSHVKRAKSRRKVYFLTQIGKDRAAKIVEHVRSGAADAGVDPSRVTQGMGPAKRLRRHTTAIPHPKLFFGREKELSSLRSLAEDDKVDIVILIGLSGIGKTTLLAKFARESKSSVFWFSFNEWETELSLLKTFADFLEETGDNRLANYLKSDKIDVGEIGYLLDETLSENRRILIFDDVDNAPRLSTMIKMIIENVGPNKVFIAAKARPSFIDDLSSAGRSINEIMIKGLDLPAARELLERRDISGKDADRLCSLTSCHPLLLRLIPANDEISAKTELSNFVKNNFLKELSARDMFIVEKCSVFRKPFSANYLSRDERHVLQLPIFYRLSGNFTMHETVRNMMVDQIPLSERREYHSRAADLHLGEKNWSERLYHLVHAERFPEAEMLIHYHSDDLISIESPQNLMNEISTIPPRISKYASSMRLLSARASSLLGDERGAIERLMKIIDTEDGEERAEALLQLADKPLIESDKKRLLGELGSLLADEKASEAHRSKAALSLATIKFSERDLKECERYVKLGLSLAGNAFYLDTISSLNRLLGQVLVLGEAYSEANRFLTQTAPSFAEHYRSMYHRLLGKALLESGKICEAQKNLEMGINIAEENGQYKEMADSLLELYNARIAEGDMDGAAETCYRCIEVSSSLGDKNILTMAYSNLSFVETKRGNQKEAEESRKIADELSSEEGVSISFSPHLKEE